MTHKLSMMIKNYYPFLIALVIALFYEHFRGIPEFEYRDRLFFYPLWLYIDLTYIMAILLIFAFPIVLVKVLAHIFSRTFHQPIRKSKSRNYHLRISDVLALGLLGFSCLIYIAALMFGFTDSYAHRDSLTVHNRVYNLAYLNTYDDLGEGSYVLYECDHRGWVCRRILSEYSGDYTSLGRLTLNPDNNTIDIFGDKLVATYHLPD